jgi:hypothetical protein
LPLSRCGGGFVFLPQFLRGDSALID